MPSSDVLRSIHEQGSYFQNEQSTDMGYTDYVADKDNITKTFQRRYSQIIEHLPEKPRVLDVGSAYGYFMDVAVDAGARVSGVEVAKHAVLETKKRHGDVVEWGTLEESDILAQSKDLITMWDVIEHVSDPMVLFAAAHRVLRKDGILALTTPDIGSIPARVMKDRWLGFKPDEHPIFFTKESLTLALENAGFHIISMGYTGKHIKVSVFLNRLARYVPFMGRFFRQLSLSPRFEKTRLYINPIDILLVITQKNE